jgi:AraC family transcriptional regulator
MTYVAKLRMRRAQDLMLNSRKLLSQVALECGLCDQAHFTRLFRRHIGTTPRVWRRQNSTAPAGRCANIQMPRDVQRCMTLTRLPD